MRQLRPTPFALLACALAASCSDSSGDGVEPAPEPVAIPGNSVRFQLDAELTSPSAFYEFPFPSDLRKNAAGQLELGGLPRPEGLSLVEALVATAGERKDVPVVPVVYLRFTFPLAPRDPGEVIPAEPTSPVLLVDVDPASPERGRLLPTVAVALPEDDYVPPNLLAVAPRPGFVLHPRRTYAFVILRSLGDATGASLGSPLVFEQLKAGLAPAGPSGERLRAAYEPVWPALVTAGVDVAQVAAATVFTTGDVVTDLFEISEALRERHDAFLGPLAVDPDDGDHPSYCELAGTLTVPQFQEGRPPFDTEGLFQPGPDGVPVKQRDETIAVRLSIPKGTMPAAGWPLVLYLHGSGGLSTGMIDRGTWHPETVEANCPDGHLDDWEGVSGCNTAGEGPAFVVAAHGFAMASSALPVNPERLPGASDIAYLNFDNLSAGRDLFRQGAIEQRLFVDALLGRELLPSELAGCTGLSLPAGATAHRFDGAQLFAQGQSMGGQYTNLISAIEPRIRGAVPTGAGGFWSYFIIQTPLIPGIETLLPLLLQSNEQLTWLHPALQLFQLVWEPVDPLVYMPRLARRPLPGHPVRSIYEPVGLGDSYFPTPIYDAVALAYGHPQAEGVLWESMQEALALAGLDGLVPLPASQNLTSEDGTPYTGLVLQYEGDGVYDPHAIYSQRDDVKHQYGCFLETLRDTGVATVVAPGPRGPPCLP